MSNTRLRLYQYPSDSRCQAIQLLLQQSELPFDLVPLNYCEPSPIIQLTQGNFQDVPVLEDLLMQHIVYAQSEEAEEIARHIDNVAQMDLFPEGQRGLQRLVTSYVTDGCRETASQICDALFDRWLQTDLERGLLRRTRELQYGRGCLEKWLAEMDRLMEQFNTQLRPLNQMLGVSPFLMGGQVTYADYALFGVLKNFLHSGATHLSTEFVHLGNWFEKMTGGQFPRGKVGLEESSGTTTGETASAPVNLITDASEVASFIQELKIASGRRALIVGCGHGQAAVVAAERGLNVTACDSRQECVDQANQLAAEHGVSLTAQACPAEQMPFDAGQFDLIVSRMSAHYFQDAQAFLAEAGRVLRMYGYVVIVDAAGLDDHPEVTQWMNEMEKLRDPHHQRFVRPNDWRKWVVPLGLSVIKDQGGQIEIPDLNWYMDVAETPAENRQPIVEMFARAPAPVRELLKVTVEGATTAFTLPKRTFVVGKI